MSLKRDYSDKKNSTIQLFCRTQNTGHFRKDNCPWNQTGIPNNTESFLRTKLSGDRHLVIAASQQFQRIHGSIPKIEEKLAKFWLLAGLLSPLMTVPLSFSCSPECSKLI